MGIFLICVVVLVIGIGLLIWGKRSCYDYGEILSTIGGFVIFIMALVVFSTGVSAIVTTAKESIGTDYQNAVCEREIIVYRIENQDNNIIGNELLYKDIVEFNNKIRTIKNGANNKWINWYYNEDIATIEFIEYQQ